MCEGLKNIFATNCIFKKIIRFYREKVVQEIEKINNICLRILEVNIPTFYINIDFLNYLVNVFIFQNNFLFEFFMEF